MTACIFAFIATLTAFFSYQNNTGAREALVKSYITLFLVVAASTEICSLLNAVTYPVISTFWIAVVVLSFLLSLVLPNRNNALVGKSLQLFPMRVHDQLFVCVMGMVLSTTLLIALVSPPNNWDSMTYHMARVAEWIQHQNVGYYPTSIDRQNYQPPLAEFAILHLQLLSKSDTFANIVQWYSFFISILLVSLIVKELQAAATVQFFSAVLAATIPAAILQSSSTQNDLVAAAFCLSFAYFLIGLVRDLAFEDAIFCGLALGLALLTKGTAYVYCFALGLTFGIAALLSSRIRKTRFMVLGRLATVVVLGLLVNVGYFSRNYVAYGRPMEGTSSGYGYRNTELSVAVVFANMIRNGALHLATPISAVNRHAERVVERLLGAELNNPKSTFGEDRFQIPFALHEDLATNLPHFLLTVFVFLSLPLLKITNRRTVTCYAVSVISAAILFCAILKWQIWGARLHLPVFLLAVPLVATGLATFYSHSQKLFVGLAILLFIYSTPFLLLNRSRPLLPASVYSTWMSDRVKQYFANTESILITDRLTQYFANRPELYKPYVAAARTVLNKREEDLGLYLGGDDWEYPLWVLLGRHANMGTPRLRHVGVQRIWAETGRTNTAGPPLVLATEEIDRNVTIDGHEYAVALDLSYIKVLELKQNSGKEPLRR